MAENNLVINVRNLNKSFNGKPAVIDVTLQVKKGEIFGFLGPNGSGKTTTIRMLCGLLEPDSCEGTCLGYDVLKDSLDIKYHVGYMTQRFSLYDDLTVAENLDFMARLYRVKDRKQSIERSLKEFGFTKRRNQLAGTLSGGWKQRLALCAALIHNPQLLLLDEPTAGVDPKARREFWDYIHDLALKDVTTLVSTHYMDEAERCTRLAYIAYGHILARGTEEEIIEQSNLSTWKVSGENLVVLAKKLRQLKGVDQVMMLGHFLNVSGRDPQLLESAISQMGSEIHFKEKSAPTMEDVFVALVGEEPDEK